MQAAARQAAADASRRCGARCAAELIGTFALVFAGCGRDHGRREDAAARPRRRRDHLRPRDHGDDLRRRPRLGRALQSGRVVRVRAHPPLPVAARVRLLGRAGRRARCSPRRSCARRSATSPHVGATLPSGLDRPVVPLGGRPDALPDVRDHGRRDRHARGRRGGGDRDRRHGRPRRDVRRPDLRRLDEPGALARPGDRLRRPARALDLPRWRRSSVRRSARWPTSSCAASRRATPAEARRERPLRLRRQRRPERDGRAALPAGRRRPPPGALGRQRARTAPHPQVVEALRELGIDASDHVPRKLDQERSTGRTSPSRPAARRCARSRRASGGSAGSSPTRRACRSTRCGRSATRSSGA